MTVAEAEVTMVNSFTNTPFKVKAGLEVDLLNAVEDFKQEDPDKDVMCHYYRLKGAEIIAEATKLCEKKENGTALARLKNFMEELKNCCVADSRVVTVLMKDIGMLEQSCKPEEFNKVGKQKMYGLLKAHGKQKLCFDSADYMMEASPSQQHVINALRSDKKV